MLNVSLSLLAAVPTTLEWSPKVGAVIILCNVLAIAIGKYSIKHPSVGPALPSPELFGGMGFAALLATTSFGHILGFGTVLGLSYLGAL